MTPIYRMWNSGFGDLWQTLALLQFFADARQGRAILSTESHWGSKRALLQEMMGVLPSCNRVDLTDDPPNKELSGYDVWAVPPLRTLRQWEFNRHVRRVTYQFDGQSNPEGKNPPTHEQQRILTYLTELGFELVPLGKHLSVEKCMHAAALSALFVGSCSGMSHLAHSVGVPVYLYEGDQHIVTCHRQKQYVPFHNAGEFEANVERYIELVLEATGKPRRKS